MNEADKPADTPEPANDAGATEDAPEAAAGAPDDPAYLGPNAEAAAAALAERVNELEAALTATKEEAQGAKDALQAAQDERLRALAEAENARRRAQKDREESKRYGAADLARDVVGVADNLARALDAMPDDAEDGPVKQLAEGVAMVERALAQALEKHHIKTVGVVGEPFDHNTCQAVVEIETTDVPPGAIANVMQKGYMLHDRLLREAMVAVAKAPALAADPSQNAAAAPTPEAPQDGHRGGNVDETA